jgi:amidase
MRIINKSVYTFSRDNPPFCSAVPEEILKFVVQDCFGGQVEREDQLIRDLDLTKANPAAGPVFIEGADAGDVLAVDILDIATANWGFACTTLGNGPLAESSDIRMKKIPVRDGTVIFNGTRLPAAPMIGVIGTAPSEGSITCGYAGPHGGNMDSRLIRKGVRVYLPVRVRGALFQLGDLHASMGDGEICGTGIEISGEVIIKTSLLKNFPLNLPVTETADSWEVNASGDNYEAALSEASRELCRLMSLTYGWDATDIFIYLSLYGNVGINQGCFPSEDAMMTLRLGIPKLPEKEPLIRPY